MRWLQLSKSEQSSKRDPIKKTSCKLSTCLWEGKKRQLEIRDLIDPIHFQMETYLERQHQPYADLSLKQNTTTASCLGSGYKSQHPSYSSVRLFILLFKTLYFEILQFQTTIGIKMFKHNNQDLPKGNKNFHEGPFLQLR